MQTKTTAPRRTILAAALIAALAAPAAATASAASPHWTLDVNLASYHTERWARHSLNQNNLGLGVTWRASRDWSVSSGFYRNSYRRDSTYMLANWTPLHLPLRGGWSLAAGATAGLDSGYRTDELATEPVVAAALVQLRAPSGWSVNLTGVPNDGPGRSGFVGAQFSLPL